VASAVDLDHVSEDAQPDEKDDDRLQSSCIVEPSELQQPGDSDESFREESQLPDKSDEMQSIVQSASLNAEATDAVSKCVPHERTSNEICETIHSPVVEDTTQVVEIRPDADASASVSEATAEDAAIHTQVAKELRPTQRKIGNRQWGCLSYCRAEEADTELQFESDDGESLFHR